MKIESINSLPVDPIRLQSAGVESVAIAHASTSRDSEISQPRKSLQKEKRSTDEIHKDLEEINKQLRFMNRSIQFSIDESSHDIVVRVIDKESGEVIREVPPESLLRLREKMVELSGLLVEAEV